jgi:multidrug efflux pump subunit AcrA (membrane-fusion protein)
MTANVTIAVGRAENVLRLPKAALRFHPRGAPGATRSAAATQNVSLLDARGVLNQVAVKTGLSDANYVEAISGELKEGDQVVIGMTGGQAAATVAQPRTGGRMGF